jgi:hypothetical protein
MTVLNTALVLASEGAEGSSAPSPYVFGGVALLALIVLLIITVMIKVGD